MTVVAIGDRAEERLVSINGQLGDDPLAVVPAVLRSNHPAAGGKRLGLVLPPGRPMHGPDVRSARLRIVGVCCFAELVRPDSVPSWLRGSLGGPSLLAGRRGAGGRPRKSMIVLERRCGVLSSSRPLYRSSLLAFRARRQRGPVDRTLAPGLFRRRSVRCWSVGVCGSSFTLTGGSG